MSKIILNEKRISNIRSILLFVYVVTAFTGNFWEFGIWQIEILYYAALFLSGIGAFYFELRNNYSELKRSLFIILLFIITAIINNTFINHRGPVTYIDLASQIGIGFLLIKNKDRRLFASLIIILFMIVFVHIIIQHQGPGNILLSKSGNHVSAINLALFGMYFLSIETSKLYEKYQTEIFIIALIVTATNILAFGRGGILSSLILLYGTAMFYFIYKPKMIKILYFIIIPLILLILYFQYFDVIFSYTKFSEAGMVSSRPLHWARFIKEVQMGDIFRNLLLGMPLDPYMSEYNHSLHNSYTQLVFYHGIGVLFVIYMLLYTILHNLKMKYIVTLFFIIAIAFRSATDVIILSGNYYTFSVIIAFYLITFNRKFNEKRILRQKSQIYHRMRMS